MNADLGRYQPKYTPNAHRVAKRNAKKARTEYHRVRSEYLRDRLSIRDAELEDRLGAVTDARREARLTADTLAHIEAIGVELGAAWSPRALARHAERYGKVA